jgi:hypothetical protein
MRVEELCRRAGSEADFAGCTGTRPLEARIAATIGEFKRRDWDALFARDLEGWDYVEALERAHLNRCEPIYIAIRDGNRCVAAAPAYIGTPGDNELVGAARPLHGPAMLLGLPFAQTCTLGFAPDIPRAERATLATLILLAALAESRRRGLGLLAITRETGGSADWQQACASLRFKRIPHPPISRLLLPQWSLDDYLSGLDVPVRTKLLGACDFAPQYELDWRVDINRDLDALVELCLQAGVTEPTTAFFRTLLGPSRVCATCLVVRHRRAIVGITLVLHDVMVLRETLNVVRPGADHDLVQALMWLETVRYCLEMQIAYYESANPISTSAAQQTELVTRWRWMGPREQPFTVSAYEGMRSLSEGSME